MKKRKTKKILISFSIIGFFSLLFFFIFITGAQATFNYVPMEPIPGFEGSSNDFKGFIESLYKFGIWTIGIAAMLMIVIGGFFYFASAGNTSKAATAKKIITDAVLGLVIALAAYLILFVINPDLVKIVIDLSPLSVGNQERRAAYNYTGTYPEIENVTMPSDCKDQSWQGTFESASQSTGVDKCLLQATAAKESGCSQTPQRTAGGRDCSVMQIAAQDHCGATCDELESNPGTAVECAANYIKECGSKRRGERGSDQWIRDTYAAYNGGCGALDSSNDCVGMTNQYGNPYLKWDCPNNCGGYCPVPARTSTFLEYYNQCKAGS